LGIGKCAQNCFYFRKAILLFEEKRIITLHQVRKNTEPLLTYFMAYKEKEIEKLYYSIGEVAEQFNVAPSLIRFWESEFDIIQPKKNRKGNRQFTKEDIENIRTIYHLVKQKGFTLQGAKEMLKNDAQAVKDKMEMYESLKRIRQFLVEVRDKLQ